MREPMYQAAVETEREKQRVLRQKYTDNNGLYSVKFISPTTEETDGKVIQTGICYAADNFKVGVVRLKDGTIHESVRIYEEKPSSVDRFIPVCWKEVEDDAMDAQALLDYENGFNKIRKIKDIASPILSAIYCLNCGAKLIKLTCHLDVGKFEIYVDKGRAYMTWSYQIQSKEIIKVVNSIQQIKYFTWGPKAPFNLIPGFLCNVTTMTCVCGASVARCTPNMVFKPQETPVSENYVLHFNNGKLTTRELTENELAIIVITEGKSSYSVRKNNKKIIVNKGCSYGDIIHNIIRDRASMTIAFGHQMYPILSTMIEHTK